MTFLSGTYLCSSETTNCVIMTLSSLARQRLCGGRDGPDTRQNIQGVLSEVSLTDRMNEEGNEWTFHSTSSLAHAQPA